MCFGACAAKGSESSRSRRHGRRAFSLLATRLGWFFFFFLEGLLAQRGYFQPCAGRKHEQLDCGGVQLSAAFDPGIGIDQRRNLFLQQQRQNQHLVVGWRAESRHEFWIHVAGSSAERHSRPHGLFRYAGGHIEREIFDGVVAVFTKAASLPARGRARFDHEKGAASAVAHRIIEKRPQDFPLRRSRLDAGNRLQQVG